MTFFRLFIRTTLLLGCVYADVAFAQPQPVDLVNPYIGTISQLLVPTFPTVHLPNSMLRVYPDRSDFTTDQIHGLPVAMTTHRGSPAFAISPVQRTGTVPPSVINYSFDQEKITPYRFRTYLDEVQIAVDFAPSHQAGVYALRFDKPGNNQVIVSTETGSLQVDGDGVSGVQSIDDSPAKLYLYLETAQKPVSVEGLANETGGPATKPATALVLNFGRASTIRLRYGISFISVEQAKKNLRRELNTYDVDVVAGRGRAIWNKALDKIRVTGGSLNDRTIFYTSLYRTYERMVAISEDGRYYSPFDNQVHADSGETAYTDDWVWDTYRAAHPLRLLIDPEVERNAIRSYIRMAQQSPEGWLPTFPTIKGDSHSMNGNHGVAVLLDAYAKGLRGFDLDAAYQAAKRALTQKSLLPWTKAPLTPLDTFYQDKGYFPALKAHEKETVAGVDSWEKRQPVPVTLAKSYDDWCLSQLAKFLNKPDEHDRFLKMAYNYRKLFNTVTHFFHPKAADGTFIEPFDYRFSGGMGAREYYDENNGWVYRWDVQHNVADLVQLMGGPAQFAANLDATFREPLGTSKYEFYAQLPDHTGNVGQFSMANEPSLHIPYLYCYVGQPWKTQKRIRQLLTYWFRNDLMGIPGDEDGGGTTAFVVFSALGFYPVTPGSPAYVLGSPLFPRATIQLGNGRTFTIEAKGCSATNKYIQSATLNGRPWSKPWFSHAELEKGGNIVLVMGDKAKTTWGAALPDAPPSALPIDSH
ncbi:GH92 family glycosyl hydrolase [uncultured Fibrella sp.]|uniref:GH92 family glycosyl hydrolase n=1 Tax=uncultured Fibrella sp. TaxID=1284596 RepID=UPI0035C9F99D